MRNVLITGATSGFGKAIAEKFAANGDNVIITGRREERLQHLKEEWEAAYGVSVITLHFDIRNKDEVSHAIRNLMAQCSTIDVLVNNAGLAAGFSPINEGELADWEAMIDTNIKGLLYMTREISPLMKQQRYGHIFNIGSTAGKQVYKNGNVYCATKFAVNALSQSMRIDLLPYGIKVTSVNPGMVETEFSLVRFKGDEEKAGKVYEGVTPLQPQDIADTVFYCANLPQHVCINDLTMTCLAQADAYYTERQIV